MHKKKSQKRKRNKFWFNKRSVPQICHFRILIIYKMLTLFFCVSYMSVACDGSRFVHVLKSILLEIGKRKWIFVTSWCHAFFQLQEILPKQFVHIWILSTISSHHVDLQPSSSSIYCYLADRSLLRRHLIRFRCSPRVLPCSWEWIFWNHILLYSEQSVGTNPVFAALIHLPHQHILQYLDNVVYIPVTSLRFLWHSTLSPLQIPGPSVLSSRQRIARWITTRKNQRFASKLTSSFNGYFDAAPYPNDWWATTWRSEHDRWLNARQWSIDRIREIPFITKYGRRSGQIFIAEVMFPILSPRVCSGRGSRWILPLFRWHSTIATRWHCPFHQWRPALPRHEGRSLFIEFLVSHFVHFPVHRVMESDFGNIEIIAFDGAQCLYSIIVPDSSCFGIDIESVTVHGGRCGIWCIVRCHCDGAGNDVEIGGVIALWSETEIGENTKERGTETIGIFRENRDGSQWVKWQECSHQSRRLLANGTSVWFIEKKTERVSVWMWFGFMERNGFVDAIQ